MKGVTIYYDDIKRGMEKMTNEELGYVCRKVFEAMESNTIPTFENELLDSNAIGFKNCLEKGIKVSKARSKAGKTGGAPEGNQNARKYNNEQNEELVIVKNSPIKPNKKFNEDRPYNYDTKHSEHINNTIERNKSCLCLTTVKDDIIKEMVKDGRSEEEAKSLYERILTNSSSY